MDRILHYEIVRELGDGKNGRTFLAMDTGFQRAVVVKLLERTEAHSAEWVTRLRAEVRRFDELDDTHIARYYSWDEANGRPFVVREYIDCESLASLAGRGSVPYDRFLKLALGAARALKSLHDQNVTHGNLTSTNVFADASDQVWLADPGLGIEDPVGKGIARLGIRDLVYLAPEQWRGEPATMSSDFYSLGVVLYHLLTGAYPHDEDDPGRLRDAIHRRPALEDDAKVSKIPGVARLLIAKLLARSPRDRFASTEELILTIQGMMSLGAERKPLPVRTKWRPSPRQWLLFPVLFMLLVILWLVITSEQP
jgi:serine/threonine-protein kinase